MPKWTGHIPFSTNLVNEAGVTLIRAVGSNPGTAKNKDLPDVNISGVAGYNQWGSAGWVHENFNWHDVLNWTHGRHTISTGMDIDRHHDDDNFNIAVLRPTFGFENILDFAQDAVFSQDGPGMKVATSSLADRPLRDTSLGIRGRICSGQLESQSTPDAESGAPL